MQSITQKARFYLIAIRAFVLGFQEGRLGVGITYPDLAHTEAYDKGRALRRMSKTE